MSEPSHPPSHQMTLEEPLVFLSPQLVIQIDKALREVGKFGEVRLIITKGRIRFIQVMSSRNVHGGKSSS